MEQAPKPAEAPKPKRRKLWVAIAAIVIIIIIGVAAFYLTRPSIQVSIVDDSTCSPVGDANCKFSPASITVSKGTFNWKNNGGVAHTVTTNATANPGLPTFDKTLNPGDLYSFTFNTPGTYKYFCSIHPWMKATVVVSS